MRVLIAGATGVLGSRITALLVAEGHDVSGMTRSRAGAALLEGLGAAALVGDVYDEAWVHRATAAFRPDVVLNELTDLPDESERVAEFRAANARIRRLGTANLLAAAGATGAGRFVTQSVAWPIPGDGGRAVDEMEEMVLAANGVVVRYGQLHGPGTYHPANRPDPPRVDIDAAAARTLPALTAPSGVMSIVDEAGGARPVG